MFNYLTTTKNLHNLLWVYSPDQSRGSRLAYYPGAAYVDVVALDAYTDDPVRDRRDGKAMIDPCRSRT